LRSNLQSDPKLYASVGEPLDVPADRHQLVEIRVIAESQGPDHTKLIEGKITFNNGSIAGKLDENKPSFGSQVISWLKQVWLSSVFIYSAIVGTGILYHENLLKDEVGLIIFVIAAIPLSLGLATSPKITQ